MAKRLSRQITKETVKLTSLLSKCKTENPELQIDLSQITDLSSAFWSDISVDEESTESTHQNGTYSLLVNNKKESGRKKHAGGGHVKFSEVFHEQTTTS